MQPQPRIPLTPGRWAFGWMCAAMVTCGLLSPVALLVSLWALRRPEPLGIVALVMSAVILLVAATTLYLLGAPAWVPLVGG